MKPIISNDKKTIYANVDYVLGEKTKLDAEAKALATSLQVINPAGFDLKDAIIIGDIGDERSEKTYIQSISGATITCSPGITFTHQNKSNIHKMAYDQALFYEGEDLKATVNLQTDYFTKYAIDIDEAKEYSLRYKSSISSLTTAEGETIEGKQFLLCSFRDIAQYEDPNDFDGKLIDKMDLSTGEVRNFFTIQNQDVADLANRDLLRQPTALLTLHYLFFQLIKAKGQMAEKKAKEYMEKYNSKLNEISNVINVTEDNVRIFGQTRMDR